MSEECNHNCGGCGEDCSQRIVKVTTNERSSVKKVIGVISGKGGVGKSLVSSLLANELRKRGHRVGILDADVTGPSIPKSFGIKAKAISDGTMLFPAISKHGTQIMSANLLLENDDDPILWRGPMIGDLVKQFFTDVFWEDVDFMVIDMPPGTGDVALTTFQSLPIDGIIIVTTPQDLVSIIVKKAIKMAQMMDVKIIGLIENMSFVECDDCGHKIELYGPSKINEIAKEFNVPALAKIGINPKYTKQIDAGNVEDIDCKELQKAVEIIEKI